jgi:ubiquinone/menaquinone biosynthesis C-methylase UbiE
MLYYNVHCVGTGPLIPHIQAAGARDILAVDVSSEMLARERDRFGEPPTLGNTPAVRYWLGDCMELPAHMGGADAVFMNSMFGNLESQRRALLKCTFLLKDGGYVVISHPLGAHC